ncbi:MAG: LysM peptidoglycan-binding domain-containing protein [Gammaproteobacteria bacterium]|nr:MAG: LysM peptidoglycan-binding domain-containing protein [Gammaproteobacteria bacterium]
MKKVIIGVIAAAFMSLSVWAQDTLLKPGHPDEYTVKKGDTLWDISGTFLSLPWKWPEIWHANPQIENPHLIYPGDLIHLVYVDGRARLTSERTLKVTPGSGTEKLSPSVRVVGTDSAISTIPLDRIDSFLSRSRIVDDEAVFATAPYILAGPQKRIVAGAGDEAYARGDFKEFTNFGVYRKGEVYRDPVTKEVLGVLAAGVGTVSIKSLKDDIATVNVIRATEEVRIGDFLLPSEDRSTNSTFFPSGPEADITGQIVGVESGVRQVGKFNVVMINRGDREGIKVGNVLAIYKKGEVVKDRVHGGKVALPDERAGILMVFRTFNKMSLALVLEADRPLSVGDTLQNP